MPEQQSLHVLTFVARVGGGVRAHGCALQLLRRVTRQEGNPVDGRVVDLPTNAAPWHLDLDEEEARCQFPLKRRLSR